MTLTNLGLLDAVQHRMDAARQHYEEALKIERQLAGQNSAVYLPDLAMALDNLGRVDRLQGRIEESRDHYQEAMTIYQELSKADPNRYANDVARVEASLKELQKAAPSK